MSKHMGIFEKKTKSGLRYQVKWRRTDGTQASKTFHTLRDAKDFKRQVELGKSRGTLPDDRMAKVKFSQFAEEEVFPNLRHNESTKRRRDGIMKKHLVPAIGNKPISQIVRADILRLIRDWESAGLSPRSIMNHLNVLRPVFKEAMLRDIITRNPMQDIKPPKAREVRRQPLTPDQCHALLESIDPEYAYAIHFVLATGVRWSEFANMKIGDFKPLSNSVRITDSKTEAGVREIPLEASDTWLISKHIADTGRNGADADSPLFTSPNGKPLHHSNFRKRVFAPACKAAGLDSVTFHDLRRTHATMLVAQGNDAKVVQERMGHRSITTTLAFYAQATDEGGTKAAGAKNLYLAAPKPAGLDQAQ
jgi:integrase